MKKAFTFEEPEDGAPVAHQLEINGELFNLATDVTGIELLAMLGASTTTAGVHRLFSRVIADGADWERFGKVTRFCKPAQFYEIATGVFNCYTDFPTTPASGS